MAPSHGSGRQTWTSSLGVTIQKWSKDDDLCLLEAVKTTAPRADGSHDWVAISAKMQTAGHARTITQARNRMARLTKGLAEGGRNFCTVCGQRRRGHVCTGPPPKPEPAPTPPPQPASALNTLAMAAVAAEPPGADIAELCELVEDDAREVREARAMETGCSNTDTDTESTCEPLEPLGSPPLDLHSTGSYAVAPARSRSDLVLRHAQKGQESERLGAPGLAEDGAAGPDPQEHPRPESRPTAA